MKRKGSHPLAARVATLQTRIVGITLLVITLATTAALSVVLSRKTDQQLEVVLARVAYYVGEKAPAPLDMHWLAGEVEELRPFDVRV